MTSVVSDLPPSTPGLVLGVDVGGTEVKVAFRTGDEESLFSFPTVRFDSPEQLLEEIILRQGALPVRICIGVPGDEKSDGSRVCVNVSQWQDRPIVPDTLGARFGLPSGTVKLYTDMQAAMMGLVPLIGTDRLVELKSGTTVLSRNYGVYTFSTGCNCAVLSKGGGIAHTCEAGWAALPVPPEEVNLTDLLTTMAALHRGPLRREHVLSGTYGFRLILRALHATTWSFGPWEHRPSDERLEELCDDPNLGRFITTGAVAGDPMCEAVADTWGSLLGHCLNEFAITNNLDTIAIQGSPLNGTPDFAEWLFRKDGPAMAAFLGDGEKAYIPADAVLYGVRGDAYMAAHGLAINAQADL